jgi:catechol 2,3-dioxygenase-like lactoylglutathione lyase family enzyme
MYSHMMVGSNDIERSKKFYDAIFTATGGTEGRVDPKGRLAYAKDGAMFLVTPPIDGQPSLRIDAAFRAARGGKDRIVEFLRPFNVVRSEAGIAAGGTAIEDPPGKRSGGGMNLYLAYLRDPDGNKLCALHRMPADA